jgi:DNA-binding MarR family transcriptional regulator
MAPATSTAAEPRAEVTAVADNFVELMRTFIRVRSKMIASAEHDVEWSAHVLLRVLDSDGPMRASTLAERLEADPSTVSRQVATLVKEGLLERRADPEDGRAALLVPTEKADAVIRAHKDLRRQHFGRMLAEWSDADLQRFAALLERFTHDFECANNELLLPGEPLPDREPTRTEGTT